MENKSFHRDMLRLRRTLLSENTSMKLTSGSWQIALTAITVQLRKIHLKLSGLTNRKKNFITQPASFLQSVVIVVVKKYIRELGTLDILVGEWRQAEGPDSILITGFIDYPINLSISVKTHIITSEIHRIPRIHLKHLLINKIQQILLQVVSELRKVTTNLCLKL